MADMALTTVHDALPAGRSRTRRRVGGSRETEVELDLISPPFSEALKPLAKRQFGFKQEVKPGAIRSEANRVN
jgi:hypothetical protein